MSDTESAVSTGDEKRRFCLALLGRQNGLLNTSITILAANPGERVNPDVLRVVTLLVHAAGMLVESILKLSGELQPNGDTHQCHRMNLQYAGNTYRSAVACRPPNGHGHAWP